MMVVKVRANIGGEISSIINKNCKNDEKSRIEDIKIIKGLKSRDEYWR